MDGLVAGASREGTRRALARAAASDSGGKARLVDGHELSYGYRDTNRFPDAYRKYVEGGWGALPVASQWGGQGLPRTVATPVEEMWCSANMSFSLCPMLTSGADHLDAPSLGSISVNPDDSLNVSKIRGPLDINDVYVFPGSNADRLVLAVTTSSPLTPAASANAAFDPDILYQIKVDNTGDAVEDLVIQFTFQGTGNDQRVVMRGPVAPERTGRLTTLVNTAPTLSGATNTILGSASGVQLFAGLREDRS